MISAAVLDKLKLLARNKNALLRSNWIVAFLLAGITFAVLSSVLVFHVTTFFTNLDNVDQFYTWYQKLATSVHHGYLPIWNANVFAGQSFAGELQPGVFYPVNLLWVAVFGSVHGISQLALDYLVATHFALAAFGCYLLLKQLGARQWTAFLAGITFAFSGAVAFRSISQTAIFFGMALLPYPLYFLARFHSQTRRRAWWLVACGALLGIIILAGHIAPFFFAVLALGMFELAYIWKDFAGWQSLGKPVLQTVKTFAVVLLSAGVIAAPQLWISSSYLTNSYRIQAGGYVGPDDKIGYGEFAKSFNLDIHEFINLVDPVTYQIRDGNNIFIGLAPLGVIILAIALAGRQLKKTTLWAKHGVFVTVLLAVSIIAMLGYATWFAVVLYELPFVYQVRQLGRYAVLFHLALMAVLAIALQVVASVNLTKQQKRVVLLAGVFLLINAVYLFLLRHHVFSLHHALQVGLLGLMLATVALIEAPSARKVAIGVLIVATAGVNTLWFLPNIKTDTKTPAAYALPDKLVDVLEKTNGQYRLEILGDALPINIGNVYNVQTIGGYAATVYAPYYEFAHAADLEPEFRNDLLGVQLVAARQKPTNGQELAYSDAKANVYIVKRPTALPKFFTSDTPGSVVRAEYHPLEVTTWAYNDQYEKYTVTVPANTTVIISEIAYPGWEATVDGQPAQIKTYTIGGRPLLKALDLPVGTHTVELTYKPFKIF